jgi:hypothetical protein
MCQYRCRTNAIYWLDKQLHAPLLSADTFGPVASNAAAVGNAVFSARNLLEAKKPNSVKTPKGMDTAKQAFARMDKTPKGLKL